MTIAASPTLADLWVLFRRIERQEHAIERRLRTTVSRGGADPNSEAAREADILRMVAGEYYEALGELIAAYQLFGDAAVTALQDFLAAEAEYIAALHNYLLARAIAKAGLAPASSHTANIETARLRLETARGQLDTTQRQLHGLTGVAVATIV